MTTVELTREIDGRGLTEALAERSRAGSSTATSTPAVEVAWPATRRSLSHATRSSISATASLPFAPAADRRLHVRGLAAAGLHCRRDAHRHEGRRHRARPRGGDRLRRDRPGHGAPAGAAVGAVRGQPDAGPRGAETARSARARLLRPEPRRARADALARRAPRGVPRPGGAREPRDRARDAEDHRRGARRARRGRAALQRADRSSCGARAREGTRTPR